jgi:hypothetical protein
MRPPAWRAGGTGIGAAEAASGAINAKMIRILEMLRTAVGTSSSSYLMKLQKRASIG